MISILKLLLYLVVLEIDVGYTWLVRYILRFIHAIFVLVDGELLELHNILCECSCFVTKNIVDHSKLFIEV